MATSRWQWIITAIAIAIAIAAIASSSYAQPPREPAPSAEAAKEERPAPNRAAESEPGYLGLIADDRREQGLGVRVVQVVEGAPAAAAGFKVDDVITAIEGKRISSIGDMAAELAPHTVDDKVRFEVRRGDATATIEVTLGRRPPRGERPFEFGRLPARIPEPAGADSRAEPDRPAVAPPTVGNVPATVAERGQLLGIRTATVTEQVRQRLRLPEVAGALVVSRVVGSPADKAGIPLDAVIVAVDGKAVASPTELAQLIAAAGSGKEVELAYFSGGERRTTVVKLANVATGPGVVDAGPAAPRVVERLADPLVNPPNNAAERIEQLERRIRELEQRVAELERSARRSP